MSEYKNDEKHNEMETRMEGGNPLKKSPGKPNDHLKLVVNEVNNSVSIYNDLPQDVSFNYDDFVMRFEGEGKDAKLKRAMKRLNLIRVLIEKSRRFQKEELLRFKRNIEKGFLRQTLPTD
jgi:hypothetical protein